MAYPMKEIEISLDVSKAIEAHRADFNETQNDILERILPDSSELPKPAKHHNNPPLRHEDGNNLPPRHENGRPWSQGNVVLPHGTKLRMNHNYKNYEGQVENGWFVIEDHRYSSPSGAAVGAVRVKTKKSTYLNGWNYWNVQRPDDGEWINLASLRRK
ncbi:MAG: hypothetical protein ACYYKD_12575 [Rhodospirillales bacterium]